MHEPAAFGKVLCWKFTGLVVHAFLMRFLFLTFLLSVSALAADEFPLGPDSLAHPEVPKGAIIKDIFKADEKSVFPGTEREVVIYVPQQLDRSKLAPFMVFQDGVIYQAPVVLDNLIHKKELPPMIGIFIKPGVVPATNENALPRYNRSLEYDSVSDRYARFLVAELLPWLKKTHGLNLSDDPDARAIAGSSSGGICAFMVAWHRPDLFRRVFTNVGTYVGIHGADQLPVFVRKFEPKPLRVYLQSGTGDNNLYCGDWWMANQTMERSLAWAGYEVTHTWGEGGHNQKHASQIFPDVMRWLWKGYPGEPLKANPRNESKWKGYEIFENGTAWEKADIKGSYLNVAAEGQVSEADAPNARSVNATGKAFTGHLEKGHYIFNALSPDQSILYEARSAGDNYVTASQITPNGDLVYRQPFVRLDSLQEAPIDAQGMCVDTEGRLYVATQFGIQVCDQAGRVNFIIPTPKKASDVCFGGKDLSELFIACGDSVYKRPTKARGVISSQMGPIKPAAPKL